MSERDYRVRAFDPSRDVNAVIDCYIDGFGETYRPFIEHSDRSALVDMVMTDHRSADVSLVAEAEGEARGVLFGGLPSGLLDELRTLAPLAGFMFRRLVSRRSEMRPFARAMLLHGMTRELLFLLYTPPGRAAEVQTLTSLEGWRGGIGRALMDAFVAEARARGFTRVDVGTDTEMNWPFYEAYGFERVASWPHHAYDYSLPGRDVTAYVYSLHLPGT